jgi:hypothetical protein
MERGTQIILFISFLVWIAVFIVFFPSFITVDNGQWTAIILLWFGGLYLEREVTKTNSMVGLDSFRSDPMKSMRVVAESFTINDSKGRPWAKFGFHPVDAGQGSPTLTIYDDKGGTITSFNVTEVGRMLEKIREQMKKIEQIKKQKEDQIIKEVFEK